MWGQFMWVNFFTSCNVESSIGKKMIEGLIPGNQFGGQLLVKIEKEKTKNPKPISKSTMLVNRASEKDVDKETQRKGDLLAKLNKVKQLKSGSTKGMGC